jgi:hypothetical protein
MCLAPAVLRDDHYRIAYAGLARRGHFIILDNGAAEGQRLDTTDLISAANKVSADEVVLPDVLRDKEATLALMLDDRVLNAIPPAMRCVIPQGDTIEEWCACYDELDVLISFATVGIPKHLERFPQGRAQALAHVIERGGHAKYNVHMFGVWGDLYAELENVRAWNMRPFIRGIDSALPFALAQRGVHLVGHNGIHVSYEWGKAFDHKLAVETVATAMKFCH